MQAYLDAGFLLTAIIPTAQGTLTTNHLLRTGAPFYLNFLHQLQVENLLVSLEKSEDKSRQMAGNRGLRLWRNYFSEGVFQLMPADWDGAFRVALRSNNQHPGTPPPFLLLLHPALAAVAGAKQFMSYDPRSREVARMSGLRVLPEKL